MSKYLISRAGHFGTFQISDPVTRAVVCSGVLPEMIEKALRLSSASGDVLLRVGDISAERIAVKDAAGVDRPLFEVLGIAFSAIVGRDLQSHLRQIVSLNRERRDGTCATHDFADTNMLMADAFALLGLRPDVGDESYLGLWNRAWQFAKAIEFDHAAAGAGEGNARLVANIRDALAQFGVEVSGETKLVRVEIAAFTRVCYDLALRVPVEAAEEQLSALADHLYDMKDAGDYYEDADYWERAGTNITEI